MQSIFARGVYLGENTSQSASVEFIRFRRTNYARGRLQAFCQKRALPFFDKLKGPRLAAGGLCCFAMACYGVVRLYQNLLKSLKSFL